MKIAGVQMDVALGRLESNLDKIVERLRETRRAGAELTVFPECAVTGYCFESREEAREHAQPIPGPATETVTAACRELGGYAVFGMLEASGERLFNAALLTGPQGLLGSYRKVHLPFLGADMFTDYGDRPLDVVPVPASAPDTPSVRGTSSTSHADAARVGMTICYDSAFPEASRILALQGADLIVLPTNWPPGAECMAEHVVHARAMENAVYYAAVNRVGTERGFTFIGRSKICDPGGRTLAAASPTGEEILYADIDPQMARRKRIDRVPGRHAIDRLADRRPEMYSRLTQAHDLKRPGRD